MDDVVLIAETEDDLRKTTVYLYEESGRIGLRMNNEFAVQVQVVICGRERMPLISVTLRNKKQNEFIRPKNKDY